MKSSLNTYALVCFAGSLCIIMNVAVVDSPLRIIQRFAYEITGDEIIRYGKPRVMITGDFRQFCRSRIFVSRVFSVR
jgi:hypothetical protein